MEVRRELLVRLEGVCRRGLLWELREAELWSVSFGELTKEV